MIIWIWKARTSRPLSFLPLFSFDVAAVKGSCCGCVVFSSGYVQIRQPDPERLLPQRGSDGQKTTGDGDSQHPRLVLDADLKMTKYPSGLYVFMFVICTCRLQLISETAWWNWWRSSCLKTHLMCDVSSLMMPSSQVDLKGFFNPLKHKMKCNVINSNFNAII